MCEESLSGAQRFPFIGNCLLPASYASHAMHPFAFTLVHSSEEIMRLTIRVPGLALVDGSYKGKLRRCCSNFYSQCLKTCWDIRSELGVTDRKLSIDVCNKILENARKLEHCSMRFWRVITIPHGKSHRLYVLSRYLCQRPRSEVSLQPFIFCLLRI
jgi:hypothetical protein